VSARIPFSATAAATASWRCGLARLLDPCRRTRPPLMRTHMHMVLPCSSSVEMERVSLKEPASERWEQGGHSLSMLARQSKLM
jgi:hypothetical protein